MHDLLNNTGFVALVGTLFGGAGLKLIESWLGRAKERSTEAQSIRDELRKDIEGLRIQLEHAEIEEKRLETLVEEWRARYYDLRDEKTKVITELTITLERIKALEQRLAERVGE
jgi:chromosome segregation ATPase